MTTNDVHAQLEEERQLIEGATGGPWVAYDLGDHELNSKNDAGWWWVWQESRLPYYGGVLHIDDAGTPRGAIGEAGITDQRDGNQERADAAFIAHARAALPVRNAQIEAVLELHVLADFGECNECSNGTPYPCATVRAVEGAA